jgi:TldD protein
MSHLAALKTQLAGLDLTHTPQVEYWDVRIEDNFETVVAIMDREITTCSASPSLGAFIRVRKGGFWFYEATTEISKIRETVERLSKQTPPPGTTTTPYRAKMENAFHGVRNESARFSKVPLAEKVEFLKGLDTIARSHKKIASITVNYKDTYKVKSFINSVGTEFEYDFNQGAFYVRYTLKEGANLFADRFAAYATKFNDLKKFEPEIIPHMNESERFLSAPAITPGKYSVLMDPIMTGVFTHESFGHKSEADFMVGNDESLQEWKLGKKIAADCLSIVDYGSIEHTSGWCPIDDDGTPARKNYLIKNGILTGRLHSRETAAELNEEPTGNSRAMTFEWEPIVRMTSTYIEAGTETMDEVLKRSEGAILLEGYKQGTGLSTFTIAPARGYRIGKNGSKEPVRVMVLSGSVFETLANVVAVTKEFHLHSSAIGGCGKNQQWPLPVADGGPYVLVKDMQVS